VLDVNFIENDDWLKWLVSVMRSMGIMLFPPPLAFSLVKNSKREEYFSQLRKQQDRWLCEYVKVWVVNLELQLSSMQFLYTF